MTRSVVTMLGAVTLTVGLGLTVTSEAAAAPQQPVAATASAQPGPEAQPASATTPAPETAPAPGTTPAPETKPAGKAKPAPKAKPGPPSAAVVVKIVPGVISIDELAARFPIAVVSTVLASRGIYLVRSTDPKATDPKAADRLAAELAKTVGVGYAERNVEASLNTSGYHAWPFGGREDIGSDAAAWKNQPALAALQLDAVHRTVSGAGVTVAVLDTGVDADHSAMSGRLGAGYDYIGDDPEPADAADGVDSNGNGIRDGAVGHGTFVSGVVALVAPQAKIVPMRVLDSDGVGNVFTIAQAINDATESGAKVINLSFGTSVDTRSKVLSDAVKDALKAGVVVAAAAGNDNDGKHKYFPAADTQVLSVSALSTTQEQLASFSNFGGWVDVAAPGQEIVGPVPGNGYARWSGTSMATPFVAGEAALMLAGNPTVKARKVTDAIAKATRKLTGKKIAFGGIDLLRGVTEAKVG